MLCFYVFWLLCAFYNRTNPGCWLYSRRCTVLKAYIQSTLTKDDDDIHGDGQKKSK